MKKENIIGLKVLRENMGTYANRVEKGESFLVMRKSAPLFKIVPVDEWGDEGTWKTIVDFTKIKKGGVSTDELLAALKRLDERDRKISLKTGKGKAR
jgi:antitoxin (DNA-binding transcriptional repressor) of toxin-antitoxin stability system